MGRVSKRGVFLKKVSGQQIMTTHGGMKYKAGIYARLSSKQGYNVRGQAYMNESIEAQVEIVKKFVKEFNEKREGDVIQIVEYYTDLGKTGSNFERSGFLRLLEDIRAGKINLVIVKDLSRFGRNYLESGDYIEKIFPFWGVRFIAVADNYDTGNAGNENKQLALEIKNLVNDMYAKDFSKKAKIHLKQRRKEGSYVGGLPPYGYLIAQKGRRRVLIPDEKTVSIVRFIYEKFLETESYTVIVDELNQRRINPPLQYKKTKEVYHSCDMDEYRGWNKSAVARILKSETYIGTLVQGKTSINGRNEKSRTKKSKDEWVVIKEAHEPLVEKEVYQKSVEIQERMKKR